MKPCEFQYRLPSIRYMISHTYFILFIRIRLLDVYKKAPTQAEDNERGQTNTILNKILDGVAQQYLAANFDEMHVLCTLVVEMLVHSSW